MSYLHSKAIHWFALRSCTMNWMVPKTIAEHHLCLWLLCTYSNVPDNWEFHFVALSKALPEKSNWKIINFSLSKLWKYVKWELHQEGHFHWIIFSYKFNDNLPFDFEDCWRNPSWYHSECHMNFSMESYADNRMDHLALIHTGVCTVALMVHHLQS